MGALNGKPVGRPPHRNSKAALPVETDADAPYSQAQLIKMDSRFCERMQWALAKRSEGRSTLTTTTRDRDGRAA
jgi:hypothetical protein